MFKTKWNPISFDRKRSTAKNKCVKEAKLRPKL